MTTPGDGARDSAGRFRKGASGNPRGRGARSDAAEAPPPAPPDEISIEPSPVAHLDALDLQTMAMHGPQGRPQHRNDGWESAITSIGTPSDKRTTYQFKARRVDYRTAIEIWLGDATADKAVTLVPEECFSKGYEIDLGPTSTHDSLLDDLLDLNDNINTDAILQRAYELERGLGGSAILMGIRDGRTLDQPVDLANIQSLDWLTPLEPIELVPFRAYQDPNHPKYGEPELYRLAAFSAASFGAIYGVQQQRLPPPTTGYIHETRLIIFPGIRVSRFQNHVSDLGNTWGDTIFTRIFDALRDFNVAMSSLGIIVSDFSQTIISIDGLLALAGNNPDKLKARYKALELGRSTANAVIVDTKESVTRQSTNVAGLSDLVDRLSMRLGADIDVPLSVLLGLSSKSLGIDPTIELQLFRGKIETKQVKKIEPALKRILKIGIAALRKRGAPKRLNIHWNSLVSLTDKERADAQLTQMRADSMAIKSGIVFPDEVRRSRFGGRRYSFETRVDLSKKAPGFVAPPPHGTPGSPTNPLTPLTAHTVGGYVRANPVKSGTEPAAAEGGDKPPGEKKDGDGPGQAVTFQGLPIVVESPKGSVRTWVDTDGTPGETVMKYDYGYVQGAMGADGDSVDVYLGPDPSAKWAYVIHQMKCPDFTTFDEDKVMLGFPSADIAQSAYLAQYDDPRFLGGMSMMTVDDFRQKIFSEAGKVSNA